MTARSCGPGRWASCRLRALPALLLLLLAAPAAGLDTIWLVRHAEKMEPWPADRDLDVLQPLSREGTARAEALADRLKDAGIAAIYTSRTARTIATAEPLAERGKIPLTVDDATTRPSELPPCSPGCGRGTLATGRSSSSVTRTPSRRFSSSSERLPSASRGWGSKRNPRAC